MDIDDTCVLCQTLNLPNTCSSSHKFGDWGTNQSLVGHQKNHDYNASALKWMKEKGRGTTRQSKVKRVALASTVYHIWTTHNKLPFEDLKMQSGNIVRWIKTYIYKVIFSLYSHVLIQFESLASGLWIIFICASFVHDCPGMSKVLVNMQSDQ